MGIRESPGLEGDPGNPPGPIRLTGKKSPPEAPRTVNNGKVDPR